MSGISVNNGRLKRDQSVGINPLGVCPDRASRVLDLGCGTGLVGDELSNRGYSNIDGLDIAPNMLAEARSKKVYRELLTGDMTGVLDLGGRIYDAAIGVGCFGNGHVGPQHLAELIRTVTPGGALVFYLNGIPFEEDDYRARYRGLAMSLSLLKFVGQASLVDEAMLPS